MLRDFIKSLRLLAIVFIGISIFIFAKPHYAFSQPSILDKILKSQDAIVSIEAENVNIYKSPGHTAVGVSVETGKVVRRRNYKTATYKRSGAGVIIHEYGIIVTNAHTVHMANKIAVTFSNGISLRARVLHIVKDLDIAFIQAPLPYPIKVIKLADSDKIRVGQDIITVGNSELFKNTVTGGRITGIVANGALKRRGRHRADLLRTTVNLYSGDSGGPLFDRKGHLIGLMTAKESATDHSSFAMPSNKISYHLSECLKKLGN